MCVSCLLFVLGRRRGRGGRVTLRGLLPELFRLGILFLALRHGATETLYRVAQVRTDTLQPLGTEKQQHDHQDNQELPDTDAADSHSLLRRHPAGTVDRLFLASGRWPSADYHVAAERATRVPQHGFLIITQKPAFLLTGSSENRGNRMIKCRIPDDYVDFF